MNDRFLITASLLDAWKYYMATENSSLDNFLNVLKRIPSIPTQHQQMGFEFEKWAEQNFSLTQNGKYQVKVYKDFQSSLGTNFLIYGILDCVKAGEIFDYKLTKNYNVGKFYNRPQTSIYLELVPQAKKMVYVIGTKCQNQSEYDIYLEEYLREDVAPLSQILEEFEKWLKETGLWGLYTENWRSK